MEMGSQNLGGLVLFTPCIHHTPGLRRLKCSSVTSSCPCVIHETAKILRVRVRETWSCLPPGLSLFKSRVKQMASLEPELHMDFIENAQKMVSLGGGQSEKKAGNMGVEAGNLHLNKWKDTIIVGDRVSLKKC